MNLTPQLSARVADIQALYRAQAAEALAQHPDAQAFSDIARGIEKMLKRPSRPHVFDRLNASNQIEMAIRFGAWADRQGSNLSIASIREYLGCHRCTAYRYLRSYRAARGEA